MRSTRTHDDHGFTLIELLVVVIIIGILAAIAIPLYMHQKAKAFDTTVEADLSAIAEAIETGDGLTGPIYRGAGDVTVIDLTGHSSPVTHSDGVEWGVTGTPARYCIAGYHAAGIASETDPLTYDSAAGGLGRTGGACDPATLPVMPIGRSGDASTAGVAGRNLIKNSGLSTGGAGSVVSQGGAPWAYRDTQTPVGTRAVVLTASAAGQGVVIYQTATNPAPAGTPTIVQGQRYGLSIFVQAPAGTHLTLGTRIVTPARGWVREYGKALTASGRWQRVVVVYTGSATDAGQQLAIQLLAGAGVTPGTAIQIAGPQIELLTTPSITAFEVTA